MALIWGHRRARTSLLGALAFVTLALGGFLALRHSSLVAVSHVRVEGLHGPQARAIERDLIAAADRMSTLDVSAHALSAAVAAYPIVDEVRATPGFPHSLAIDVVEQQPVAVLETAGHTRTAVAANGAVLGPALSSASALPTVYGYRALQPGKRVSDAGLLGFLAVLGAAPRPMIHAIARVYSSGEGLTLSMRDGLVAYFGDPGRPHAKWTSLDAVLADPGSHGASYVDVRVPSRPAAGFPAGVTPPLQSAQPSAAPQQVQAGGTEATVASIASVLASSNNGTASPSSAPSATEPPSGASATTSTESQAAPTPTTPEASGEAGSSPAG